MLGLGASLLSPYVEGVVPYSNTKSLDCDLSQSNGVNTNYDPQSLIRASHSWSWWMKPDDGRPSSAYTVFGQSETNDANNNYRITIGTNGTMGFYWYSNGDIALTQTTAAMFSDGAQSDFTHFVLTRDHSGTDVVHKLYKNSIEFSVTILAGFNVTSANAALYDSNSVTLGIDGMNSKTAVQLSGGFDGLIDEFAAFTKVLSPSEVTAIYNGGTPKDESGHDGLELYYRFEDNLVDTAGTSNGSAVGTVTFSSTTP